MAAVFGRYARAFAEVVIDRKINPDKAVAELNEIAVLVNTSTEFRNVLQNPSVALPQKLSLLDAVIQRTGGSKVLRNFIAVLIEQRRIGNIGDIVELFKQELDRRMGIADARVSSARELAVPEKKCLSAQVAAITGKTVRATYSEDATLLGGAVVRVGSTIYDGSVRGQFQRMREEIKGS